MVQPGVLGSTTKPGVGRNSTLFIIYTIIEQLAKVGILDARKIFDLSKRTMRFCITGVVKKG